MCKSVCELVIGIIVVVFTFVKSDISQYIIVIAGIALIIHSLACKKCFMPEVKPVATKKRK